LNLDDDLEIEHLVKMIAAFEEYKYQMSKATVKNRCSCTGLTCQCCVIVKLVGVKGKYPPAIYLVNSFW